MEDELGIREWMSLSDSLGGKTVLITGATGYLGKVLVEKLLREFINLRKVFILIRAKDKFQLYDRFLKFKQNEIFERICKMNNGITLLDKLHPINGDLSKLDLGLNENDKKMLLFEVNLVLHSGALVKFDVGIKDAVLCNVRGTRDLLNVSQQMKKLQSFVYVSTAYSNCYLKEIDEKVYPSLYDPNWTIELCEKNLAETIKNDVFRTFPNTYAFSKNLAEKLVYTYKKKLPLAIVRPPIISPAQNDPYPGWVDSLNGPEKFVIGAGSGFIRCAHGNRWANANIMPVDYVGNAVVAVAVYIGKHNNLHCPVYNLTNSSNDLTSWYHLLEQHKKVIINNPYKAMLWYPGGTMYMNYYIYLVNFLLFQLLPSIFLDILLFIFKGRTWFLKTQLKSFRNLKFVSYFFINSWVWKWNNTKSLFNRLSTNEKVQFNFSMDNLPATKYIENWNKGSRIYLLKISSVADKWSKIRLKVYYSLDKFIKLVFTLFSGYFIMKIINNKF